MLDMHHNVSEENVFVSVTYRELGQMNTYLVCCQELCYELLCFVFEQYNFGLTMITNTNTNTNYFIKPLTV